MTHLPTQLCLLFLLPCGLFSQFYPMASYGSLTLAALKLELKKRNAKVSGRKQELVNRLEFLDRHGVSVVTCVEYHMKLPDVSTYKDIHVGMLAKLPKLTEGAIDLYMVAHDAKWKSDKVSSLYKERYLRHVRSSIQGGETYLSAAAWAEMAKHVSYKVDIKIDTHGVVVEAQCECGAGQGPAAHCKHVGLLLHAYSKLWSDGKIITALTCTQVLQTFHTAKPFKGSPLKSHQLQSIREKKSTVYDPRPEPEENLKERARNLIINYQANHIGSTPMPLLQAIPPANTVAVAYDHDYLSLNPQDQFLKDRKISVISRAEIDSIEQMTRAQGRSMEWREQRKIRITASHFGEICKATVRKDLVKLAQRLVSPKPISGAAIEHGTKYEDVAVQWFEKKSGIVTQGAGLFISASHPYLGASPDRIIDDKQLIEVKCPYTAKDKMINSINVPYLEMCGDDLALKRNHDYYYQVQGQLFCSNRSVCHFIVFTLKDQKEILISRDEEFISKMKEKLVIFYQDIFQKVLLDKEFFKNYLSFNFSY